MSLVAHFTPLILSFGPLLARAVPWDPSVGSYHDLAITETVFLTQLVTAAITTVTVITTTADVDAAPLTTLTVYSATGASASAVTSLQSTSTSIPEATLILSGSPLGSGPVAPTPPPAPSPPPDSSPSQTGSAEQPGPTPLLMAYYPDWAASSFPPEKIDFRRFDWIDFAFALPNEDLSLSWDSDADAPALLTRLVAAAHAAGKNVKLSIGGWTGSKYFSTAVADSQSRLAFAANILALYVQYNLDGIDIDWEYPGQNGNDGNRVAPDDSANFLAFLQCLRTVLPPRAKISAAVQTVPFADASGAPMRDVSAFAAVLDWVLVMNYDTWGSSQTPGPNAPLSDACGNATQPAASAAAAFAAWTAAHFPAAQLALGVPSYGYLSRSAATALQARAHLRRRRRRLPHAPRRRLPVVALDADPDPAQPAVLATGDGGGADSGQIQFRELVRQGVLQPASTSSPDDDGGGDDGGDGDGGHTHMVVAGQEMQSGYGGGGGFARRWDVCSQTPFLTSRGARQVVAYDDPLSLALKAALVRAAGMRGVNLFDVHGDTDAWDLADALRAGLGLPAAGP